MLHSLVLTLPRPAPDEPQSAWQQTVQDALDILGRLNPRDALETFLAVQYIALGTGALDAGRLAMEPGASAAQAHRHRATAAALTRALTSITRLLAAQRQQPPAPARDWGHTAAQQAEQWQATQARPSETTHMPKPDDAPAVIVKYMDEIDHAERAIATEQHRRQAAGEPPLPRKPGEPVVIYSHKPRDYIRKFSPDPKNFEKYPGWKNLTMDERRKYLGDTYTGPLAPPDALSPETREKMRKQMATDELLKAEYGT
jgi:hypothetical protein